MILFNKIFLALNKHQIIFTAVCILLAFLAKLSGVLGRYRVEYAEELFLILIFLSIPFLNIKVKEFLNPIKFLYRGTVSIFLFYLVWLLLFKIVSGTFIITEQKSLWLLTCVGCATASLFRLIFPVLLVPAFEFYKASIAKSSGFHVSEVDYIAVSDFLIVLTFGMLITAILRRVENFKSIPDMFCRIWGSFNRGTIEKDKYFSKENCIVIFSISVHFCNYLYSAYEKVSASMVVGENWVTVNETQNLFHIAKVTYSTPLVYLPPNLLDLLTSYLDMPYVSVLINMIVVVIQIMSIFFFLSRKFAAILTLAFDLSHIGIFILTGIFFWKWIILNLLITATLTKLPSWNAYSVAKISLPVMVISPFLFTITFLGWFDARAWNDEYFQLELENRSTIRLPSNYFFDDSVTVAQQSFMEGVNGTFHTRTWGFFKGEEQISLNEINRCDSYRDNGELLNDEKILNFMSNVINQYELLERRLGVNWVGLHLLYPHHIWSFNNPFGDDFSIDNVTAISLIYEPKCLRQGNWQVIDRIEMLRLEVE